MASSYYDDFIVGSEQSLARDTDDHMCMLFKLLGWKFDTESPKADEFSGSVSALRVVFDLSWTHKGIVSVKNTEKRKSDLDATLCSILDMNVLGAKDAQELRGKLAFAECQILGKAGQLALRMLSKHIHKVPFQHTLEVATHDALKYLRARLCQGLPRVVPRPLDSCWFIYTDAAFEKNFEGGLGGVLISPSGSVISWFSLSLCSESVKFFIPENAVTGIGELETVATAVALRLWETKLARKELVAYIDNEGSRMSLCKGVSKSHTIATLCFGVATHMECNSILAWFARVSSASNIADSPSRDKPCALLPECKLEADNVVETALAAVRSHVSQPVR